MGMKEEEQAREWKGGRKGRRKGRRQWEREGAVGKKGKEKDLLIPPSQEKG